MRKKRKYQFKKAFRKQIEKGAIRNFINKEMKDLSCIKISDATSESLEVGPLKEGDSLFRRSENIEDSFLTNSRKAKGLFMLEGYINSALNLLNIIKESNGNLAKDSYVFPALFNFRQYLELTMKESISSFENPIIVPLRYTFSIPVYSILNPAPSSSSAEILPSTFTSPAVGFNTPVMILRIVDLPEPFVPIIPTVSPLFTSKFTSRRA